MKIQSTILFVFILLLTISCGNKAAKDTAQPEEMVMAEMSMNAPPPGETFDVKEYCPKLIKKGNLTISATDIEATKNMIYQFVKRFNGYVVSESLVNDAPVSYYQLSLNIQATHLDKFVGSLDSSKLNIVSRNFSVEDVTMQYIDDTTRLENKKKLEKRYLDLLSKTTDIKNIMEVEEKLESIRTDIESRAGQLKVLDRQIAYSELSIRIEKRSSNLTFDQTNRYSYKLIQGFVAGWEGVKTFLIFLISLWPFYIVLAVLFFVIKVIVKKKNNWE